MWITSELMAKVFMTCLKPLAGASLHNMIEIPRRERSHIPLFGKGKLYSNVFWEGICYVARRVCLRMDVHGQILKKNRS